MGQVQGRSLSLSGHNEIRSILKRCFQNNIFSFVPFEIWKQIILNSDVASIRMISRTCWGFRILALDVGGLFLEIALKERKKDEIFLGLKYLQQSANLGNGCAMFHLGYGYFGNGWNCGKNIGVAGSWLKKSSEAGNPNGMAVFAYWLKCYYAGKNAAFMSVDWAKKALDSNNSFAIAYCLYQGIGTFQDQDKAANLFLEASMEGEMHGQFFLGNCYMLGRGVSKSREQGFLWYSKSAEQGFCRAQYNLAKMYRDGDGCEKNEQLADFWFKRAANQGHFGK